MRNKFASTFAFSLCVFLFAGSRLVSAEAAYQSRNVRVVADEYGQYQIVQDRIVETTESIPFEVQSSPQMIVEHERIGTARVYELSGSDHTQINEWLSQHAATTQVPANKDRATDEVRPIVDSGPTTNRINLVFMGDGYLETEKEKFFTDIKRLVNDMFVGKTFTSYLPLFNVYAVFRASKTSGIGKGKAIDTAYGLYREGETLRAIFPSNKTAIRSSCDAAPACDYPVVIANDPYYGGLGGEFAISTSSVSSGSVVLRHELGHNFGKVGEEYDGGGYFGANSSFSPTSVKWSKWTTEKVATKEPMFARHLSWPWYKLDKGPKTVDFQSDGKQAKTWIRLSVSGVETSDTLSMKLDGKDLSFSSPNRLDRSFINIELPALNAGKHSLEFAEHVDDHNNWLSNLTIHEYAADFHNDPNYIGAFPVFAEDLSVDGYRPTNESCLMRDMEHPFFCPVCQENNWLRFFAKVKLIDNATAKRDGDNVTADATLLGLGQFRKAGTGPAGEMLDVRWYADGTELAELRGKQSWTKPTSIVGNELELRVTYLSKEIRSKEIIDSKKLTMK